MIKVCKHGHEIHTQEEMRSDGACKYCIALVSKKNTLFKREVKATLIDKCDLVCANCHAIRTFDSEIIAKKISQGWKNR
jgi:formate-dependent nitrite reductase cytochrome c552 subunit